VSQSSIHSALLLTCCLALVGACTPELCVGDCDEGSDDSTAEDELAQLRQCSVQSTIDDSTCGDGVTQADELCFGPAVILSLAGDPAWATAGDFDGDGRMDVLWTNEAGAMELRVGAAIGPLSTAVALSPSDPEHPLVKLTGTGDFDGDGLLDVVAHDDRAVLLRGRGDGSFDPLQLLYDGTMSWGPAPFEADGDGDLDLLVIDPNATPDNIVLSNDGTGAFTVSPAFHDGDFGTRFPLAYGDFDGEGPFDRATGIDDRLRFQTRDEAGLTESWLPLAAEYLRMTEILLSDVDGDGRSDLLLQLLDHDSKNSEGILVYTSMAVLLADGPAVAGSPSFDGGTYLPMDCSMSDMELGDIDGDGILDVVASHYTEPDSGQSASIVVRRGDGLGGFGEVARIAAPVGVERGGDVLLGDFDGDGRLDVAVFIANDEQLVLYRGAD